MRSPRRRKVPGRSGLVAEPHELVFETFNAERPTDVQLERFRVNLRWQRPTATFELARDDAIERQHVDEANDDQCGEHDHEAMPQAQLESLEPLHLVLSDARKWAYRRT